MAQLIKNNKKIASPNSTSQPYNQCNCRVKRICPLPNKCLYTNTINNATVKTNNSVKHYIGATEGTIKQRIHNHNLSFKCRNYASNTSLSSYIWQLKDANISPTITREILKQSHTYNKTSKKCRKQGRTHKRCTLMDPHIWPCKSRTTSTNIHSAAM